MEYIFRGMIFRGKYIEKSERGKKFSIKQQTQKLKELQQKLI